LNFKKSIFFLCYPQGEPDKAAYQHGIVCIAEGLKELGIKFYSNIDYWKIATYNSEYLFSSDRSVNMEDCDVVVVNDDWVFYGGEIPENIFSGKILTVYIDNSDGTITKCMDKKFKKFDVILRSHYNCKFKYPENVHPWAFGLSNRIINITSEYIPIQKRKNCILFNFRIKHRLRELVNKKFIPRLEEFLYTDRTSDKFDENNFSPYDLLMFNQSGRRHYPNYFTRLSNSVACSCFGGGFVSSIFKNPSTLPARIANKIVQKLNIQTNCIIQYDSWRFWESLVSGCVTFHVDFEKYGLLLPVMPKNWENYIGIDLSDINQSIKKIKEDPNIFNKISVNGRKWALENYSPRAQSLRFIDILNSR